MVRCRRCPGKDRRHQKRKGDLEKGLNRVRPKAPRRLLVFLPDPHQPRLHHQHHEGHVERAQGDGHPQPGHEELARVALDVAQVVPQAEGDDALALRVAVRPGGCSGFSYEMFFDSDIAGEDVTADFQGVKVVVDASSAQMLAGATLDYKDGLNQAGFSIDNPNAQRTCGCGSSFS